MKINLKQLTAVPLYVKVIFVVMVLLGLLYIFKPNAYKDFYKLFNKELQNQEMISKKSFDSITNIRKQESLKYQTAIKQKEIEIEAINIQLDLQKQKAYRYEKQLKDYIRGDFDERFRIFSDLVKKDTVW